MRQDGIDKGNGSSRREAERNEQCLRQALAKREAFLESRPHLRAYQAEIDSLLEKSGDSRGRIAVLLMMTEGKLIDLQKELYKLAKILRSDIESE